MKINKRQIVFLSLALVVCIAVYLNWRFLNNVDDGIESMTATNGTDASNGEAEEHKVLGQAQQRVGHNRATNTRTFPEFRSY